MTRLEMVEKLREKTGASYEEARQALENNDWDMLDALIALKRQTDSRRSSEEAYDPEIIVEDTSKSSNGIENFGEKISGAVRFVFNIIGKCENLKIDVYHKNVYLGSISALTVALLEILCWYVPIILLILMLILGFRFRISNKTLTGKVINGIGSKVIEKAEKEFEAVSIKDKED